MEWNYPQKNHGRIPSIVLIFLVFSLFIAGIGYYTDFFRPLVKYLPQSLKIDQTDPESEEQSDHSDKAPHKDHKHKDHKHEDHKHKDHKHEEHQHDHEAEDIENTDRLSLDDASLFNIGIRKDDELTLKVQDYQKSFRIPGIVREIPGRSINSIAATVSGIITKVEAKQGETLCPGSDLLEIQLTHEETIQCQTRLIEMLQKQDVIRLEEQRLGPLAEGIAPKQQRELLLQKVANTAAIQTQKNLLKIHGFTEKMIEETIVGKRQTIDRIIIRVPEINEDALIIKTTRQHFSDHKEEHYQILEKLLVNKGDTVRTGDLLCQISDLRTLQIEGKVFAANENIVNEAYLQQSPAAAIFADPIETGVRQRIDPLKINRIDNFIDHETQTVSCWIDLPNTRLTLPEEESKVNTVSRCGKKTSPWRFKPGQRCELAIEYETIRNCFVLPPEAVAIDRSNAFVFEMSEVHDGKRVWTKKPIRILYRASDAVVAASDETIRPGMKVAKTGAEQLYIALGSGSGKLQSACEHDH